METDSRATMKFDQAKLQDLARRSRPLSSLMEMDVAELQENVRRSAPRKPGVSWPWRWALAGGLVGLALVAAFRLLTRL